MKNRRPPEKRRGDARVSPPRNSLMGVVVINLGQAFLVTVQTSSPVLVQV